MADARPSVLLVASDDWLSSGRLAGLLHEAGCHVTVLCPPHQMAMRTRHVDRWLPAPPGADAVIEALRRELERQRYQWVLAADGPTLQAMAARRTERWVEGWFPVDPRGPHVELLFSKLALAETAARWDLAVPRSLACWTRAQALRAGAALGFPLLLKADRTAGGAGTRLARDEAELAAAAGGDWGPSVAQEFIRGRDLPVEAFYDRGRLTCWVSSYRERAWPEPYGPSTARRYVSHPAVLATLETIGQRTRLHGFASFDFREEAGTGRVLLLEIDARPTPCLHQARRAGVDFALAVRRMLAGHTPSAPLHQRTDRAPTIYMFPQDPVRALARGTPAALLPWLFDARRWRDVPFADPPLLDAYARCLLRASPARRISGLVRAWWKQPRSPG